MVLFEDTNIGKDVQKSPPRTQMPEHELRFISNPDLPTESVGYVDIYRPFFEKIPAYANLSKIGRVRVANAFFRARLYNKVGMEEQAALVTAMALSVMQTSRGDAMILMRYLLTNTQDIRQHVMQEISEKKQGGGFFANIFKRKEKSGG